jgi:RimJ/RimL family protein N-acetyltransferase
MEIIKRAASIQDLLILLEWRNAESAIKASQQPHKIQFSEHEKWLQARIKRHPSEPFWIMESEDFPIGYVRLDLFISDESCFTVSLFVNQEFQGRGFGKQMLKISLLDLTSREPSVGLRAVIRNDNLRSQKLFTSFGFTFSQKINKDFNEYQVSSLGLTCD